MRYMLDTNAVSVVLRGHDGIDTKLSALEGDDWCISAVTRAELRFGVALKPEAKQLARLVSGFLELSTTAPWDADAADAHGKLRAALRKAGTPIGDFDEMIAAHALALGCVLVTDNVQHFKRVKGLKIENWVRAA
jgi:tRNA(fMet)-specific endonuclease VapC